MNTTVAIILCAVLGFVVSALLGIVLVPWLHKLKFGQTILDIGPSWHKKKQGTPTMGGIMFIIATIAALLAVTLTDYFLGGHLVQGADLSGANANTKLWGGILVALGFAIIGFADDYIKVVKKRNLGLTEKQRRPHSFLWRWPTLPLCILQTERICISHSWGIFLFIRLSIIYLALSSSMRRPMPSILPMGSTACAAA